MLRDVVLGVDWVLGSIVEQALASVEVSMVPQMVSERRGLVDLIQQLASDDFIREHFLVPLDNLLHVVDGLVKDLLQLLRQVVFFAVAGLPEGVPYLRVGFVQLKLPTSLAEALRVYDRGPMRQTDVSELFPAQFLELQLLIPRLLVSQADEMLALVHGFEEPCVLI